MPVTINGDGSITGLSVGGLGSGVVNTATLADGAATGVKQGTGSVIQVLQTNVTAASNLTVSATNTLYDTPSIVNITSTIANSKFVITGQVSMESNGGDHEWGYVMIRRIGGSDTQINIGDASGSNPRISRVNAMGYYNSDNSSTASCTAFAPFVDSPSQSAGTTITYKIMVRSLGGGAPWTMKFNRVYSDNTSDATYERPTSYITVMEVAP